MISKVIPNSALSSGASSLRIRNDTPPLTSFLSLGEEEEASTSSMENYDLLGALVLDDQLPTVDEIVKAPFALSLSDEEIASYKRTASGIRNLSRRLESRKEEEIENKEETENKEVETPKRRSSRKLQGPKKDTKSKTTRSSDIDISNHKGKRRSSKSSLKKLAEDGEEKKKRRSSKSTKQTDEDKKKKRTSSKAKEAICEEETKKQRRRKSKVGVNDGEKKSKSSKRREEKKRSSTTGKTARKNIDDFMRTTNTRSESVEDVDDSASLSSAFGGESVFTTSSISSSTSSVVRSRRSKCQNLRRISNQGIRGSIKENTGANDVLNSFILGYRVKKDDDESEDNEAEKEQGAISSVVEIAGIASSKDTLENLMLKSQLSCSKALEIALDGDDEDNCDDESRKYSKARGQQLSDDGDYNKNNIVIAKKLWTTPVMPFGKEFKAKKRQLSAQMA